MKVELEALTDAVDHYLDVVSGGIGWQPAGPAGEQLTTALKDARAAVYDAVAASHSADTASGVPGVAE